MITLINGEKFVDLLLEQQLGVKEKTVVEIDDGVFDNLI